MNEQPSHHPAERFIAQFDWDGAQPVYRRDRTGPAYLISVDEYQSFIEMHERQRKWSMRLYAAAVLAIWATIFFGPFSETTKKPLEYFFICFVLATLSSRIDRWLFLAPTRALRSRTPVSPALSKNNRLRLVFGEMSWTSLLMAAVLNILLIALVIVDFFEASPLWAQRLFTAIVISLLGRILLQMIRKWRFEIGLRASTAALPAGS